MLQADVMEEDIAEADVPDVVFDVGRHAGSGLAKYFPFEPPPCALHARSTLKFRVQGVAARTLMSQLSDDPFWFAKHVPPTAPCPTEKWAPLANHKFGPASCVGGRYRTVLGQI